MLRIPLAVTLGMYELKYHIIISPYICTHLSQNNIINTTTSNMIAGNIVFLDQLPLSLWHIPVVIYSNTIIF